MVRVGCRGALVLLSEFPLLVTRHHHLGEIHIPRGRATGPRRNDGEPLRRGARRNPLLCGAPMETMARFAIIEIPVMPDLRRNRTSEILPKTTCPVTRLTRH